MLVVALVAGCTPGFKPPVIPSPIATATPTPTSAPTASPTASPTTSPTASPTPMPGVVTLTPTTLNFTATGATYAQSVAVAQSNYIGTFTATTPAAGQPNSCASIATIASASSTSFSITPQAAGTCTFTIAGGGGQSATLNIVVTTTVITGG